jgi:hypothetical protein
LFFQATPLVSATRTMPFLDCTVSIALTVVVKDQADRF